MPKNPKNRDNQQERLQRRNMSTNWLKQIPDKVGFYFAGFADGEGSFNVSLRNKQDYKKKWQVCLCFNVSQRDITILAKMKRYLGCGKIKKRKDGLFMYDVSNFSMIKERIIPFFQKFSFQSASKKKNFLIFCQIANLMNGEHLTEKGLKEIILLREKLNVGAGRKRKYCFKDIYGESSETIR